MLIKLMILHTIKTNNINHSHSIVAGGLLETS